HHGRAGDFRAPRLPRRPRAVRRPGSRGQGRASGPPFRLDRYGGSRRRRGGMPLDLVERPGGKVLAWACALALVVALVGLLVATSESLRRQEGTFPFAEAVEPDLPLAHVDTPDTYHAPGAAGWPVP